MAGGLCVLGDCRDFYKYKYVYIYIYIHIYIRGGLGWGGDVNVLTTASLMLR